MGTVLSIQRSWHLGWMAVSFKTKREPWLKKCMFSTELHHRKYMTCSFPQLCWGSLPNPREHLLCAKVSKPYGGKGVIFLGMVDITSKASWKNKRLSAFCNKTVLFLSGIRLSCIVNSQPKMIVWLSSTKRLEKCFEPLCTSPTIPELATSDPICKQSSNRTLKRLFFWESHICKGVLQWRTCKVFCSD